MPRGRSSGLESRFAMEREEGFNLTTTDAKIPGYSSLTDRNMAAYYEKRTVRKRMIKKGFVSLLYSCPVRPNCPPVRVVLRQHRAVLQMDTTGRTYDINKKNAAINVIEQEFRKSQKEDRQRMVEEKELRRRIQSHRRAILETEQRERRLQDLKADRALGQEVARISRAVIQPELNPSSVTSGMSSIMSETASSAPDEGEEDDEDLQEEEAEVGNELAGMTEQERNLMKAMNAL